MHVGQETTRDKSNKTSSCRNRDKPMQGQPFGLCSKVDFVSFKLQNVCFIQRPISYLIGILVCPVSVRSD